MNEFDAIIVGGGIQGATMALETVRRGLRPLVLERGVPGAGVTAQGFGIVHGGLRYLQQLDIPRWLSSHREQAWFLTEFPDLVKPLPCVMPLYRGCYRSPSLFRLAFLAERALSRFHESLPQAELLSADAVVPGFPIARRGLVGAACWPEGVLTDPIALTAAILQRAVAQGAVCLASTEALDLRVEHGRIVSLCARGANAKERLEVHAPNIILCAGAATRTLARHFDRDYRQLSSAILAFNVLLDLPAPAGVALAVSPTAGRGRSYFIRAEGSRVLAGTWYAPWREGMPPHVSDTLIESCLSDLRNCLPGIECTPQHVQGVLAGVLPDTGGRTSTLRSRDVFLNHERYGGAKGLYSVLGTKLTTARALAYRSAEQIWPRSRVLGRRVAESSPLGQGMDSRK